MDLVRFILLSVALLSVCDGAAKDLNEAPVGKKEDSSKDELMKGGDFTKPMELKISGFASVHFSVSSNDLNYYSKARPDKHKMDTDAPRVCGGDAEVAFRADKSINDNHVGADVTIETERGDIGVTDMRIRTEWRKYGMMYIGSTKGPEKTEVCGVRSIMVTPGPDGSMFHEVARPTGTILPEYVGLQSSRATKIVYHTNNFQGFRLSAAFTPDTKQEGHDDKNRFIGKSRNGNDDGLFSNTGKNKLKPYGKNHISLALSHTHEFDDDLKTKVCCGYVTENTKRMRTGCIVDTDGKKEEMKLSMRKAGAYHISASVKCRNVTVAGGFLCNGKSRLPSDKYYYGNRAFRPGEFIVGKGGNAGFAWDAGIRYDLDKVSVSAAFFDSSRKVVEMEKAKMHILSLSVEYRVLPGFALFTELDFINGKSCNAACSMYNSVQGKKSAIEKQNSALILIGMKVAF